MQKEFTEQIKDFRNHFEMILEGEKQVDLAKAALEAAEAKEVKARKEHKRATTAKKAPPNGEQEVKDLAEKLTLLNREKELAQAEVLDRTKEHEIVKMIRVKDGLTKFTQVRIKLAGLRHKLVTYVAATSLLACSKVFLSSDPRNGNFIVANVFRVEKFGLVCICNEI